MDQFKRIASFVLALVMVVLMAPVQFITANAAEQGVTISFADKADRTAYDTTQQVWEQNGITVTNDKAASKTNVGDYSNPARFYQNSMLTVTYPGMTAIDFHCDDYKDYVTPLVGSITASGATVSSNGTIVTVALAAATDSFVIENLIAQVRMDSITVYTAAGVQPTEPVETEPTAETTEPEETAPTAPAGSVTVVDAPVAGTAYKFGMVQGNVENKLFLITGAMNGYYMATTEDAAAAADVYLEETAGGYYLYAMVGGAKKYINMVVSGTHVNGAFEDAASTVYTYDAEAKSVIAAIEDVPYWFGTRNDNTYTTVGPCKTEYNGFYCQFYTVEENGEAPVEPTAPSTEPTEPSVEPTAPSTEPEETTPSQPAAQATISFADKAARTEFTNDVQVWEQNGIAVTNSKGKSTSNTGDYVNPVRFYKSTKLEVSYPGMTQIVFNCASADYSAALKNSIVLDSNTIASGDGAVLTVTFASPVDTFTVESLTGGQVRVNSITVYSGEAAPTEPVETEPDETIPVPEDPAEIVDAAYALGAGESLPYVATLTGKITAVNTIYSEQYQNVTVTIVVDGKEDKPIECYRLKGEGADQIDLGDTITVQGVLTHYVNTDGTMSKIEFVAGCVLLAWEDSGEDVVPTDPAEIVDAAYALGAGESLPYAATLTGKITAVNTVYSEEYQNVTVTIVVDGKEDKPIECYRLKGEGADQIGVDDIITVRGVLKHYVNTEGTINKIEFDAGCELLAWKNIEEPVEPTAPTDPVDIVDIATAVAAAEGTFTVKGVVTVVDSSNYYVQDATGGICVRLAEKTAEISLGDTIIGTGVRSVYNGMPQLQNATYEMSSGLTLTAKETTIDALTTADICTYVTIKGLTVTEINDNNGQYTTPNVSTVDAAGNPIQIYKAVVAKDGDTWAIQVGDVIDVTAGVGCYKETLQLRNTLSTEIVLAETGAEPEEPTAPTEPEVTEPTAPSEPEATEPTAPSTEPTEPATPAGPAIVEKPVAGTAYKFGMVQGNVENKLFLITGAMSGYYMATTEDATAAADVYLEETADGYYLYTMVDGAKKYINMVVSGTHVNGAFEDAASTVYTYDTEAKTVIAIVEDAPYWFGTRNDKAYTTAGPCKTEYEGFYCQFYTVSESGETPSEPTEPEETKPTEPATPAGPAIVEKPVAGTAYKFGMVQGNVENKLFLITGAMSGYYMATTEDATAAADVYLEETADGYYLYAMVGGAKKYINMVVSGTHVNGAFEDAAATVYTYDTEAKTVIAIVEDAPYWFGTRNDKAYTTAGPCKTEYEGFYCQFYTVSESGETPTEPTEPEETTPTQPTEPEETTPTQPSEPEVPEIVDIATALAGADGETFIVKGVVTVIDSSNYYVQDATGAICVRLASKTTEIALGDTIIGTGTKSVYNGLPQLQNATFEKSSGMTLSAKETTVAALTIADICTYVTIKGLTVTEIFDNNGQYTSPNVTTVDADGNTIQIYKAVVAKNGDTWAIQVGDVIDVTGGVGYHNGKFQLRNTLETEIVLAAGGEEPEQPSEPGEQEVVGDFNGDGFVTDADAVYLLRHTLFANEFPITQDGDINGDGNVTDADAVYLLRHTLFPGEFPLNK